ncbi:hypothetical protein K449DRAFT_392534 [Hypoxylon sp. EC38]|nr:hypothetical protein K449DRAFT_392534 [Hypoxylon sp. EC38]
MPTAEQEVVAVTPPPSGSNNELALEVHLFEDLVTTVYITVTPLPIPSSSSSSSPDLSADAQHLSSSSSSSSSSSASSSSSIETSSTSTSSTSTSSSSSETSSTTSTLSTSTSPTTLSSSTAHSTSSTATSATATTTASGERMYCAHSKRPDVWTICRAPATKEATSAAIHRMSNPLSALRLALVSLWSSKLRWTLCDYNSRFWTTRRRCWESIDELLPRLLISWLL